MWKWNLILQILKSVLAKNQINLELSSDIQKVFAECWYTLHLQP